MKRRSWALAWALLLAATLSAAGDVAGTHDEVVRFAPGGFSTDDGPTVAPRGEHGPVEGLPPLEDTVEPVGSPPVIAVTATPAEVRTGEQVLFDATASVDPDGEITSYRWDLFAGGRFPLRTAEALLPFPFFDDGVYDVRLRVTDNDGNVVTSAPVLVTVTNRPPQSAFTVSADSAPTGTALQFDASGSEDADGEIVLYRWDLDGDGTPEREETTSSISHSYADDGRYTVRLFVVDDDGAETASEDVTVRIENRPPTASFSWTPAEMTDALEVEFLANATDRDGEVTRWQWTFGDGGTTSTEAAPHRFPDDGEYAVTLVVTDDDGARSDVAERIVTVLNAPPQAVVRLSSRRVETGEEVVFTDLSFDLSPHGEVIHMGLEFGDGAFVSGGAFYGAQFSHVYAHPGEYVVTLYAVDDDGGLDVAQTTIEVR